MQNQLQHNDRALPIKFAGKMTYAYYDDLERRVLNAMRAHKTLAIDLSEVTEIDLCGIHLVGRLQSTGVIVAVSPVVEQASKRWFIALSATPLTEPLEINV